MEFIENWYITATLGEGAFGEVKLLHHTQTGQSVALKILQFPAENKDKEGATTTPTTSNNKGKKEVKSPKKLTKAEAENLIKKEIAIHKLLKNENVVQFYGARMEADVWYIFLEYADGGELYDRIEPDVGLIPHTQTLPFFTQLISGVTYLHSKGICHRDLKPENILIANQNVIKISDFGLSSCYRDEQTGKERLLETACGTPPYLAPEVISKNGSGGYYKAMPVDVWSCGVILVVLLGGELPWDRADPSVSAEYKAWKESTPTHLSPWNKFDLSTLNFFKRLLCPLPSKRITLEGIKEHVWMKKHVNNSSNKRKPSGDCSSSGVCDQPPSTKRSRKSNNPPPADTPTTNTNSCPLETLFYSLSQPDPIILHNSNSSSSSNPATQKDNNHHLLFSFSQPPENAQEVMQEKLPLSRRLVHRMTRFFVKSQNMKDCLKTVTTILDEWSYQWKVFAESSGVNVVTINTVDKRKSPLVFKCMMIEIEKERKLKETLVLLDFRLSRGDGIEFKRHFLRLRDGFGGVECRVGMALEWLC